jgi:predicted ATPase/DNA-binding CsgD family transcriptional regulator
MTDTPEWSQKNLPRKRTSFIGREAEILEIHRRLADPDCHLITLVGPGGIGKTRLAIAAVERAATFTDRFFVPLQPVTGESAVLTAIADTIGLNLQAQDDPVKQIGRYLNDKKVILVLDNFEHLLGSVPYLSDLLAEMPALKLLVTSREVLNLEEEWLLPIEGLPVPAKVSGEDPIRYDAVALFYDRARRVRPDFSLADEETAVIEICRLVGGLPLAIELAAAWFKTMTSTAIVSEIQNNLNFLSSRLRNIPERHRSVQAVFNQSWQMLNPAKQQTYAQLSVFRGGFRRDAAEAIASANLEALTRLVEKSLLVWETNGRYQIHELLRQFAAHQLAQSTEAEVKTRQRHARYYIDFLAKRTNAILGHSQLEAAAEITADIDNIRQAWQWFTNHLMPDSIQSILRAIEPLALFFQIKGKFLEGAAIFTDMLERLPQDEPSPIRALLLTEIGWFSIRLGQFARAQQALEACLAIYRELEISPLPGQGTDPRLGLSTLASIRGDYRQAENLAMEALRNGEQTNHLNNIETAYFQLASVASAQGRYEEAQKYAQASYDKSQEIGDLWFMGFCLSEMGLAARALGEYDKAKQYFEKSYTLREQFADPQGMGLAMKNLGEVALYQEQFLEARQWFQDALAIYLKIDDRGGLAAVHNGLGRTALFMADFALAQKHFHTALQISEEIQFMSLLLSVLAGIGEFLIQTKREEQGRNLLNFVATNPATDKETFTRVDQLALDLSSESNLDLEKITAVAKTELTADIAPEAPISPIQPLVDPLTERELEVLQLIAQGKTNQEIADNLFVVLGTIKAHNNRIYSKLDVSNRTEAVARARELNLIPSP